MISCSPTLHHPCPRSVPDPAHTTEEMSCGFLAVPCAPSAGRGSPPWKQELLGAGGPRHSFSRCISSSGRDLNSKRQRGQRKAPMSNTLESRAGEITQGTGRGAPPAGLAPWEGLKCAQSCWRQWLRCLKPLLLCWKLGWAGRAAPPANPGHSHCLPRALEREKRSPSHLGNLEKTK